MIDNKNKNGLHNQWNLKIIVIYVINGIKKALKNKKLFIFPIVVFLLTCYIAVKQIYNTEIMEGATIFVFLVFVIISVSGVFYLIGKPISAKQYMNNLHRINIVNSSSEAPLLIDKTKDGNAFYLTFYSQGVPLCIWQDNIEKIESALNIRIDYITEGNSVREIVVKAVSGNETLPKKIVWRDNYLSDKDFCLVLGKSYTDFVKVDLSKIPHMLIGGSTGSGKSVLLRLMLYQCILKGAEVYIADFKGGVDYGSYWNSNAHLVTQQDKLIEILTEMIEELERRKTLLKNADVPNISVYNSVANGNLKRIIVSCDEVAELLDKTGLQKTEKDKIYRIEGYLSTIARQGRAFGIHLILATQRPDSNILCGQIKNNIDYRVCGRADIVLSEVILDKGIANDRIPKNSQGRFINQDEIVFQAFWFEI